MLIDDLWGFVYHDLGGTLILSNYANVSSLFISLMYDLQAIFFCLNFMSLIDPPHYADVKDRHYNKLSLYITGCSTYWINNIFIYMKMKIKWIWINFWRYRTLNTYSYHVNKYRSDGMEEPRETPMELSKSMHQTCYLGGKLSLCKLSTPFYYYLYVNPYNGQEKR